MGLDYGFLPINAWPWPLVRLEETIPHPSEDFLTVSALEMVWYMGNQILRVADWAGMAHSLEIRVPLVDIVLLRKVAPLRATKHCPTKLDMAGTLVTPWPAEVINRPKSGFLVPVQRWLAAASCQGAAEGTTMGGCGLKASTSTIPPPYESFVFIHGGFWGWGTGLYLPGLFPRRKRRTTIVSPTPSWCRVGGRDSGLFF
jgi:hypothetical protein